MLILYVKNMLFLYVNCNIIKLTMKVAISVLAV